MTDAFKSDSGCEEGCFAMLRQSNGFQGVGILRFMQTITDSENSMVICDPKICHGQPTFRGTRILVADVLEQVASGMDWDAISAEWRGAIDRESIAQAVRLARRSLLMRAEEPERAVS